MIWTTEEIILAIDGTRCADAVSTSIRKLRTYLKLVERTSGVKESSLNFTLLVNLQRLFVITHPTASNVYIAGGVLASNQNSSADSVTGTHFSSGLALIALIGEIAEALARDPARSLPPNSYARSYTESKSALEQYGQQLLSKLTQVEQHGLLLAKPVSDLQRTESQVPKNKAIGYPEVLCRAYSKQPETLPPISEGYAAHHSLDLAIKSGICEKFERDAAAAWWIGGLPPRQLNAVLLDFFEELVNLSGQPKQSLRRYQLLDLTIDFGPSVFAAMSSDAHGHGLAIGFGCSFNAEDAVKRAFLELKQMEFAQFLAWKKQTESGAEHLNRAEKNALARANKMNVRHNNLFRSRRAVRNHDLQVKHFCIDDFALSAQSNNISLYYIDLSSTDKGPFVVKVLSPDLMSPVLGFPQSRLNQYTSQWGVSEAARLGVELL